MRTMGFDCEMQLVELKPNRNRRHKEEVYFRGPKGGTQLCISPDLFKSVAWINGDRLNLLASNSNAMFGLIPSKTGLLTLNATGGSPCICNTDLCVTIRAKCKKSGYEHVTSFKAWVADGMIMFTPKEA